jgi:hypothetical protein
MHPPAGSIGSDTFAIQEDSGRYLVDATRGYIVTKGPTRLAQVTSGKLEFLGVLRANALGAPGPRQPISCLGEHRR